MYPLIELGPLRLSSGGLLLIAAAWLWGWLAERAALRRGGAALVADMAACSFPALIGAALGARLWYGLGNSDLYGARPSLFFALRISDLAWPGALVGAGLALVIWARRRGASLPALIDCAALALPLPLAIGWIGMLLSGEAFGMPATLPWAIPLFGADRHPTQLYAALAALLLIPVSAAAARRTVLPAGSVAALVLALHGLSILLIDAVRADAILLPGGVRSSQLFGLALLLIALRWGRGRLATA